MRARFSQWLLILREGATADGAGRGRSVHKRNPLRIPVARRPTHLIANGGIAQMRAHAAARLWRKVFPHEMKGRSHELIKPGGLGLHLIRNAFDQVLYIHKRRGTELVLTKNLE